MNKLISTVNQVAGSRSMVWLLGTLIGTSCIAIYAGIKVGALVLGIWTLASVALYYWNN